MRRLATRGGQGVAAVCLCAASWAGQVMMQGVAVDMFSSFVCRHVLSVCITVLQQGKHGDFPSTQHPFSPVLRALSCR